MTSRSAVRLDELTLQRICGEYLEMPGLKLTLKQAHRLWALDEETCARSLEFLVERRFLVRTANGSYARQTGGSVELPAVRMAKASLDRSREVAIGRTRAS